MSASKSVPQKRIPKLKFGSHKIPMTEAECAELEKRFSAWQERFGIPFGFVRSLLHVRG